MAGGILRWDSLTERGPLIHARSVLRRSPRNWTRCAISKDHRRALGWDEDYLRRRSSQRRALRI